MAVLTATGASNHESFATITIDEKTNELLQDVLQQATDVAVSSLENEQQNTTTTAATNTFFDGKKNEEVLIGLAGKVQDILKDKGAGSQGNTWKILEKSFQSMEQNCKRNDQNQEFDSIESFIKTENKLGRQRRSQARTQARKEEERIAADVAKLKAYRFQVKIQRNQEELQRKIMDAERSYSSRKMVYAKAAQDASAECRRQFARVRDFFETLHGCRKEALYREYQRSLGLLAMKHHLINSNTNGSNKNKMSISDARVIALDKQIATRLYQKKEIDLNAMHAAQTLEEALYLESMLNLLDQIQSAKETAARELFDLRINYFKDQQEASNARSLALEELVIASSKQMAELIAQYTEEDGENEEDENAKDENIDAMEREKAYFASKTGGGSGSGGNTVMNISQLFDTVLWSVATGDFRLTTAASSSLFMGSDGDILEEELLRDVEEEAGEDPTSTQNDSARTFERKETNDDYTEEEMYEKINDNGSSNVNLETGSTMSKSGESIVMEKDDHIKKLSPRGNIHVKHVAKELRMKEKELVKQQIAEERQERRKHRAAVRALAAKHKTIIESLLERCLIERANLRELIEQRMKGLAQQNEESTKQLHRTIEKEAQVMQDALRAESKRLVEAETTSFNNAQTLISAQVFHEVRNALSSVIAMSEITKNLKEDTSVEPKSLIESVDDMLDQTKEVVQYSLLMLNNVLDLSKMNTGDYDMDMRPFDLNDMLHRATKMQLSKAGDVNLSFTTYPTNPHPCVAVSDGGVVNRVVTNLISNALKFTTAGAVQPFALPLEKLLSRSEYDAIVDHDETKLLLEKASKCINKTVTTGDENEEDLPEQSFRLIAVGVADTGVGLSHEKLKSATTGLAEYDPTQKLACVSNTGFGLFMAHRMTRALGAKLQLANLKHCGGLFNPQMVNAIDTRQRLINGLGMNGSPGCHVMQEIPGPGTVLFFTLPVVEESSVAQQVIEAQKASAETSNSNSTTSDQQLVFSPRPSPDSKSFRILVADDILVLRKGMVNTILDVFKDLGCSTSISTAITAEDALRALGSDQFDLFICDNQFSVDPGSVLHLEEKQHQKPRPRIFYDEKSCPTRQDLRLQCSAFFKDEHFTVEDGDGVLTGYETLMKLEQSRDTSPFYAPVLLLLSGHAFKAPPASGVIIAQKPLRGSDLKSILESHIQHLLNAGFLCMGDNNDEIFHKNGTRFFSVKKKGIT